jgi:hypothetical protein
MVNFNQEAIELAKQIVFEWKDNEDFQAVVTILEDYITDLDTKYRGLLESSQN